MPFTGEANNRKPYDEKYGRPVFDNNLITQTHCQNSFLHFERGLRGEIALKNTKKIRSESKDGGEKKKNRKHMFWVLGGPTHLSKKENLTVKVGEKN